MRSTLTTQTPTHEDHQLVNLKHWLDSLNLSVQKIHLLKGDAGTRRYFRVTTQKTSYIAMDASLQKESCPKFVDIANDFRSIGVNTPTIHQANYEQGFLLLTDFGDELLNNTLTLDNANEWYQRCFDTLILIQQHQKLPNYQLQEFNNELYSYYEESSWFITWYLQQYKKIQLSAKDLAQLEREIHLVSSTILTQPKVVAHRDFHSRNIMITDSQALGFLDFQDAAIGAIAYDLSSLLRDYYVNWPIEQVHAWVKDYHQRLCDEKIINNSFQEFLRWFDWGGMQRHLKCAGLFVRLNLRDNKPDYQQYIPTAVQYIQQCCEPYPEFKLLKSLTT